MTNLPLTAKIRILVEANPHRAGSKDFERFETLKSSQADTVALAIEAGLTKRYLVYAQTRKLISIEGINNEVETRPTKAAPNSLLRKRLRPITEQSREEPRFTGFRSSRFKPSAFLFNDPSLVVQVISTGPEQSEIKFANGNVRTVCNDWMTPLAETGGG